MTYFTSQELNYHKKFKPDTVNLILPNVIPKYNNLNTNNFLFSGYQILPNGKIIRRCTCKKDCPKNFNCISGTCQLDYSILNPI